MSFFPASDQRRLNANSNSSQGHLIASTNHREQNSLQMFNKKNL